MTAHVRRDIRDWDAVSLDMPSPVSMQNKIVWRVEGTESSAISSAWRLQLAHAITCVDLIVAPGCPVLEPNKQYAWVVILYGKWIVNSSVMSTVGPRSACQALAATQLAIQPRNGLVAMTKQHLQAHVLVRGHLLSWAHRRNTVESETTGECILANHSSDLCAGRLG